MTCVHSIQLSSSFNGSSSSADAANASDNIGLYSVPGVLVKSLPYIVGLRSSIYGRSYCAGALVAPKWVLTTVDCSPYSTGIFGTAHRYDIQYASIASMDVSGRTAGSKGEQMEVVDQIPHPDYNKKTRENDYMLLQLASASTFDPVPLAPDGVHCFESDISGSVFGWDWSPSSSDATWPALLNTTMRWASDCHNTVDKVYASEFCAIGTKTTDACHISGGSPVVLKAWGQDILVGMVSYNPGCGKSDTPKLFARTSKGQKWIVQTIAKYDKTW